MAAGDRNRKGKATDIVRHYSDVPAGKPICKTKGYGYSVEDKSEVTCLRCLKLINPAPNR